MFDTRNGKENYQNKYKAYVASLINGVREMFRRPDMGVAIGGTASH